MPRAHDRVKDSSTTTGTGNITLSGSAATGGFQTFNNAYGLNTTFAYVIVNAGLNEWETGTGYLSGSTTLVRASVDDGSSGIGVAVNFSAGTKDVFSSHIADWVMDTNSGAMLARAMCMAWS